MTIDLADPGLHRLFLKERGQAVLRITITGFFALYFGYRSDPELNQTQFGYFIAIELVVAIAIAISLFLVSRPSLVRRTVAMLCDYTCLAGGMMSGGQEMALIYPIFLWVTIGNGMRYGYSALLAATLLGMSSLGVVLLSVPFWVDHRELSAALLVGMILIPAYLSRLMKGLHDATSAAERASQAKSQFLATMSHEVRTPLSGLLGMTEMLATSELRADQKEQLSVILESARSLKTVVDGILNLSTIEAGKLTSSPTDFNLRALVESIEAMLLPSALQKQLRFEVAIADATPNELVGDAMHVRQILANLLNNAIKFTDAGEIRLDVRNVGQNEDIRIEFKVSDTGIGIPLDAHEKVFTAFEQAEHGTRRRYGGSGLGMTIARALTQLAGGTIRFTSVVGEGTTFTAVLPFARSAIQSPQEIASQPPQSTKEAAMVNLDDAFVRHRLRVKPMHILVGDDQASNIATFRAILQKAGHSIAIAKDGEALLDIFAEDQFDAIILDLHMPGLSGVDVLKMVRVMEAGRDIKTPIIVASADLTRKTVEDCLKAGIYEFVPKPLDISRLLEILSRIFSSKQKESTARVKTIDATLLAEDRLIELETDLGSKVLLEIIELGFADIKTILGKIHHAGETRNWSELQSQCQALATVALTIGASQLKKAADELHALHQNLLPQLWREKTDGLRGQFELAQVALSGRGFA